MFKLDAINKYKRVVREIVEENPYLTLNMEDNAIEYFKDMIPLLKERLNAEELSVMTEDMSLSISGGYNDRYYFFKNVFDSLIIHQVDPETIIREAYEAGGFTGINI